MSLEFNKVVQQVYKMGVMLEKLDFDLTATIDIARERFDNSGDLDRVNERIDWVRSSDISGYRGAAPVDMPNAEPINAILPEPDLPEHAIVIAADGGQVYPDELAPVHYYLINLGLFIYHHGFDITPEQITIPDLRFHKDHVHDRYGRLIRNRVIDDRRTVAEMRTLAQEAWKRRQSDTPLITLYDNRLLFLPSNDDSRESNASMKDYHAGMVHLHDSGATLGGYIDNPFRSRRVIQLLHLLTFDNRDDLKEHQATLSNAGDMDGLRDVHLYAKVLDKGERSAIMVQSSPQNKEFRDRGINYEIAFFYLKVYNDNTERVIRVDIPMWVARDPVRVNHLHALIINQCKLQGRNPYPYALTRADELAWIGGKDKSKLEELVYAQVRRVREELIGSTLPAKARGKQIARSEKRYHEMRGSVEIDER
ncbi:MAG: DNA double-strand break repair nuclease NurA [Phototrophicaceae bacterium]